MINETICNETLEKLGFKLDDDWYYTDFDYVYKDIHVYIKSENNSDENNPFWWEEGVYIKSEIGDPETYGVKLDITTPKQLLDLINAMYPKQLTP